MCWANGNQACGSTANGKARSVDRNIKLCAQLSASQSAVRFSRLCSCSSRVLLAWIFLPAVSSTLYFSWLNYSKYLQCLYYCISNQIIDPWVCNVLLYMRVSVRIRYLSHKTKSFSIELITIEIVSSVPLEIGCPVLLKRDSIIHIISCMLNFFQYFL